MLARRDELPGSFGGCDVLQGVPAGCSHLARAVVPPPRLRAK